MKTHDRLLHVEPPSASKPLNPTAAPYQPDNVTSHSKTNSYIALRTIPVILKSKDKSVTVNALLDDGSTKTYINTDIASILGLSGEVKNVTVNVLDGQVNTFQTMPVEFELQSIDKNVTFEMNAFTTKRVTGHMEVIDWSEQSKRFPHLSNITFHSVQSTRPIVDVLIGLDHPEIHRSIKEVYGPPGEPYARLGPLGWTCIGKPFQSKDDQAYMTYFLQDDIGSILKNFWEVEQVPKDFQESLLSPKDKQVLEETEKSLKYESDSYEVGIPWLKRPSANNYKVAKNRLENTEKKLARTPEVKKIYAETIRKYEEKDI